MVTLLNSRHNYERNYAPVTKAQGRGLKAIPARWSKLAFGIDISSYQKITAQWWKDLKEKAKIDFVFAKCSEGIDWIDPSFAGHVQGAYDVGIPMLAYHYFRTGYYVEYGMNVDKWPKAVDDKQLLNLKRATNNKKLYGIMLDIEDTSTSMTWTAFASGVFAGRMRDWLDADPRYGAGFMSLDYLGEWGWAMAPDQFSWLVKYPLSIAKYPYAKGAVTTTWEELREKYFPVAETSVPTLCCAKWDFWQFSGEKFKLPYVANAAGRTTALDLQLYNGTVEELYKRIGFAASPAPAPVPPTPVPVEEPTLEERVARLEKVLSAMVEAAK